MNFKMIFLVAVCGFALSSLSGMSDKQCLALFVRAVVNDHQRQINAMSTVYNNRGFIVALKNSKGNAIAIPGERKSFTFRPGVLDKARVMLKIAEQHNNNIKSAL